MASGSDTSEKGTTSVLPLAPAQETAACSTVEERRFSAASSAKKENGLQAPAVGLRTR
jgi:hypothetical protein